ncbi:hypothetical protein AURDEDRAFT_166532 [Auricularia subglabra TFB-10046 SS5]|nr:hypothetical protein AURDEDRAFT_166532 [Auricularia subglabra TFB-10046 SS5]
MSRWPESTLTIGGFGATTLVLCHDGCATRVSATSVSLTEIRSAFSSGSSFASINHLVLPLRLLQLDSLAEGECPLISGTVELPSLSTLTLRCGPEAHRTYSLIEPNINRGTITAPLLSRLLVERDREQYGPIQEVPAAHLAAFIENTLRGRGTSSALDLVIDTEGGVRLHCDDRGGGDFYRLRACVKSLIL